MRGAMHGRAKTETQFFEALLHYVRTARSYCKRVKQIDEVKVIAGTDEYDILRQKRAAVARQILTPAPSKTEIAWKRKAAQDKYLPISPEDVAAAILADEAFLEAHPLCHRRSKVEG